MNISVAGKNLKNGSNLCRKFRFGGDHKWTEGPSEFTRRLRAPVDDAGPLIKIQWVTPPIRNADHDVLWIYAIL
jgi:hypothetical protein